MKTTILLLTLSCAFSATAQERASEFNRVYPADRFQELILLNRLGNVDVRQGGDQFEIKAEIMVKAKTLEKADEVMEYLKIDVTERPGILHVNTLLEKDLTFKKLFHGVSVYVDYHVKVPKGKKLGIANKNGNVFLEDFTGDLNVEVISGDFKARHVEGDFTAKLTGGNFEVQDVNRFTGDFSSANVNIRSGERLKLTGDGSHVDIIEAGEVIAKCSGGSLYLGRVDEVNLHAAGAKSEIQHLRGALRADTRSGQLAVHSVDRLFSAVDITASGTRIALSIQPGGGFNVNFRHDNIKIKLPRDFVLETKPTMKKKVSVESGFVGDKQYNSRLSLDVTGGSVTIE
ncbi:MAG: hypothetical protein LBF09_02980 [Odoribacteraceae bacterium]|jgi:hypothetical protein|nr:hypothetical protein [Odoribacteraceae bacterium]